MQLHFCSFRSRACVKSFLPCGTFAEHRINLRCFFLLLLFVSYSAAAAKAPPAKRVIEIWVWGGPSQLETFDPKPAASADYNNGLKAIPTAAPGMEISELLPRLAKEADKFSVIRTMNHPYNGHEVASYLMQTGREPGGGRVFPALGAVVAYFKSRDYHGDLPPYVVLTVPKGRFSEAGFLGERYKPLATGGNPNAAKFMVDGITPPESWTPQQETNLYAFADRLDTFGHACRCPELDTFDAAGREARRIADGPSAKAFDLSLETPVMRDRYGRTEFGQSCLVARRLVEAGVPYVTINAQGWDTHKNHFGVMKRKAAEMDQALAALLADLAERKLLDSTIVWWSGEFGRTPKIQWEAPWNGGRGHYAACFSAMVAGGGFKGGQVVGVSDATASHVVSRPVAPQDLLGSILERCGIDPDSKFPAATGVDAPLLPPESAAGRLRELYPEDKK